MEALERETVLVVCRKARLAAEELSQAKAIPLKPTQLLKRRRKLGIGGIGVLPRIEAGHDKRERGPRRSRRNRAGLSRLANCCCRGLLMTPLNPLLSSDTRRIASLLAPLRTLPCEVCAIAKD